MENSTFATKSASSLPAYVGSNLWISLYCIIIIASLAGNILTISAILLSRQLWSLIANQFIFSLAVSDLLVAITTPYHMCFYLLDSVGRTRNTCMMRFVLIIFSCASSVLNLFFIATDRYLAVIYPLRYNRSMTRKVSTALISFGWLISLSLSTVPIYWNMWHIEIICDINVIPYGYFTLILTPLFILVWTTMLTAYVKIWSETAKHARRIRSNSNLTNYHTVNDTKSIQVVMMTLGCFSICWIPYFIVTTYYRITENTGTFDLLYEITFTMAVGNSGINPVIYAWKNSNFRSAFRCLLTCHSPNEAAKKNGYITNHVPTHKSEPTNIEIEMMESQKEYDVYECSSSTDTTNVNSLSKI